jgi:crotonobetainyl-CoA:carnitine CoA-transferase CaiB-like acyl-CoA transferase
MPGSLEGITVIDLSRVLAGPFCGMLLGDMGADVIKVESPGEGDESRFWPPIVAGESAGYLAMNRNRRAITLNLKTAEGQEILKRLVRKADVLIENFRTGTMERLGLGYEILRDLNPGLAYCAVSVAGRSGPAKDRAGYEALMQAYSGIISITGDPDGPPARCGVSFLDLSTGIMAAFGIMNALYQRKETGKGQLVEVSLFETALSLLSYHAIGYLIAGVVPQRHGSAHPSVVPYQVFQTQDGEIFIVGANQRLWTRLCQCLQREDLLQDPRFATQTDRVKHRTILVPLLQEEVKRYPTAQLAKILDEAGIPCAPVNTVAQALEDPQTQAREMIIPVSHPTIPALRLLGLPVKLSENPGEIRKPPPLLGQHTDEVLRELGYTDAEIERLHKTEVV